MFKKINHLILSVDDSKKDIKDGLIAIAKKIKLQSKIEVISIDLEELESMVNPKKVKPMPDPERIEVEI